MVVNATCDAEAAGAGTGAWSMWGDTAGEACGAAPRTVVREGGAARGAIRSPRGVRERRHGACEGMS